MYVIGLSFALSYIQRERERERETDRSLYRDIQTADVDAHTQFKFFTHPLFSSIKIPNG